MTGVFATAGSRAATAAIPLTVIGGFLGAGKTTLVNSILAQSEARHLAVLVNDFGALSIDGALISARGARTISLTNGCVCCTLVGGLAQALIDVLELDPPPDHVLVEASGVGDPRRIAQIARADRRFAEDATVVVAAADQIQMLAGDRYVGDTVLRQLEQANLIVLNKRDLVDEAQAQRTLRWLRPISPGAQIIEAVNAELPCDVVLGPATRNLVASSAFLEVSLNASSRGNTAVTARRSRHVRSAAQNRSWKTHCAARSMFFPMQCCAPRASCDSILPQRSNSSFRRWVGVGPFRLRRQEPPLQSRCS